MVAQLSALGRVIDFLSSRPDDEDILNLKATPEEEQRIDLLSSLRNEGLISQEQRDELHNCLLAEYVMGIAKANAYGRLNSSSN